MQLNQFVNVVKRNQDGSIDVRPQGMERFVIGRKLYSDIVESYCNYNNVNSCTDEQVVCFYQSSGLELT